MKYRVYVSGAPRSQGGDAHADPGGISGDGFTRPHTAPAIRRFPPVIQFLTDLDPLLETQLQSLCIRLHRQGKSLSDICLELYLYARSVGYELVLGVQETTSSHMPSFPGQTVHSALLMADVRPISAPGGYHQGRMAV